MTLTALPLEIARNIQEVLVFLRAVESHATKENAFVLADVRCSRRRPWATSGSVITRSSDLHSWQL